MAVRFESNRAAVISAASRVGAEKLFEAAHEIRGEILETLSGERHGRMYRVPGTRRLYQASKAGEAPASRTGNLRRSITVYPQRWSVDTDRFEVGTDLDYGLFLELGTRKMSPRPFIKPSAERALPTIERIFSSEWDVS